MKVRDLVYPDKDAMLYHPTIGKVAWNDAANVGVRYLNFAEGDEKGNHLYPDWDVLEGDDWSLQVDQWREDKKE